MLAELAPWLIPSGGLGVVVWLLVSLHRSAIRSEARRADAWERIAMMRERQMEILTGGSVVAERVGPRP